MKGLLARIAFFVALFLLFTAPGALAETRVMVATDLHYLSPTLYEGGEERLRASALYGDGKMPHRSDAWLRGLVQETIEQAPDALILMGDQSYNGEVISHRDISDALAEIQAAGIPVLVIPGNHDINNDNAFAYHADKDEAVHSIPMSRYEKYYAAYGFEQAFSVDTVSWSYAARVTDTLWVVMMDAGIYEPLAQSFGLIELETRQWLEGVLRQAHEADAQVITVSHQSMLPHSERVSGGYMVVNGEDISDLLIANGVRLHLSGHIHVQHIAEKQGLYDVALSALSSFPNQYAVVTFSEDGQIRYDTKRLHAENLPDGLLEESEAFFEEVNYYKVLGQLRKADIQEADKEKMAVFAAWMNAHYYAGTASSVQDIALEDAAYALWKQQSADTFWVGYLQSMVEEPLPDMNHLVLP